MNIKKIIMSSILGLTLLTVSISTANAQNENYEIKAGDTFWKLSQRYNISCNELMNLNKATENTVLYIGQTIIIPSSEQNINYSGQVVKDINANSKPVPVPIPNEKDSNIYKVQKGDTLWKIAMELQVPFKDFIKANNLNENSIIHIGDTLNVPVYNIAIKETPSEKYGEYLDWWTEAQYVIPIGAVLKVEDFNTGKTFMVKRTAGANHAELETLSIEDTKIMKEIWGGEFKWQAKPVIIHYNGRKLAASCSGMPHAGNDKDPGGVYTTWRSEGYGPGNNLDWVKNNDMDGHFDLHFKNSTRHKDGKVDTYHQENAKVSAGVK